MPRQRYSAEQWQQLIEQQASSGQSQVAFCAAHGLSTTTFQHWKRRLRDELTASSPSAAGALFTPLLEPGVTSEETSERGWDIELALGDGICLRIRRGS